MVFNRSSSFCIDLVKNKVTICTYCSWLVKPLKIFSESTSANDFYLNISDVCVVLYIDSWNKFDLAKAWPRLLILVSDWMKFEKLFSSKTNWLNDFNAVQCVRSSTEVHKFFYLAKNMATIFVSDWLIFLEIFSSETAHPYDLLLAENDVCEVR